MDFITNLIEHNIWILIPLMALLIPFFAIATSAWTQSLEYRQRREAIELLKTYADSGREPPEALVEALARPVRRPEERIRRREWREDVEDAIDDKARYHGRYWGRRGVYRAANSLIWTGATAAGLYWAWAFYRHNDGFLIAAIVMGCITAASALQLLLAIIFLKK